LEPGLLIAKGRSADVYEMGPGKVIRRYRDQAHSAEAEASVMSYARRNGIPVPRVFEVEGPDMVLERVDGPTMLKVLSRRPAQTLSMIRVLAELHSIVHSVDAPEGLRTPFGAGRSLLHLDLHPDNVVMAKSGPVVIDWPNAAAGPAEADNATTWIILKTSTVPGGGLRHFVTGFGQSFVASRFRRAVGLEPSDPRIAEAARRRMVDRNLLPEEAARIEQVLRGR
jgi:aminoglycoside phosphotransferase (APT) family kinase protein